jgi:cell shape-determining protein MreC
MNKYFSLFLMLLLMIIPLVVDQIDPGSIWDDIANWFENAMEDVRSFFDNLGENLARAVENMADSLRNLGQSIAEQFNRAVEGVGTD